MKKILPVVAAVVFFLPLQAQTQSAMDYDQAWKNVARLEERSLPRSASEQVELILRKAVVEKNTPQIIKAIIHQGKYDLVLDSEADTLIFRNLKQMLESSEDPVERSVLHSMLGELYLQYYDKERWSIDRRTAISGYLPEDMKEWSKNNLFDKAVEHLNASIDQQKKLEETEVKSYEPLVVLGKDSRRFYPSMYDFLALRAIEFLARINDDSDLSRSLSRKGITQQELFLPAEEFVKLKFDPKPGEYDLWALECYKKLLLSLSGRGLDKAVALTDLSRCDYLAQLHDAYRQYALPLLQSLQQRWEEDPVSVEIIDKIADLYLSQIGELPQEDTVKRADKTRELYRLLQRGVQQFPGYGRTALLENRLLQLTQPRFEVEGKSTFGVKSEKSFTLKYQNLKGITARLYRLESPLSAVYSDRGVRRSDEMKSLVSELEIPLHSGEPYETFTTRFKPDLVRPGAYKLEFESNPAAADEESSIYFSVSDLALFSRLSARNSYEFFVVNRVSGQPVRHAQVKIYRFSGSWPNSTVTLDSTLSVNELGMAAYSNTAPSNELYCQAVTGADSGSPLQPLPWGYFPQVDNEMVQPAETVNIFTDRGLYRPGQTVFFKVVAVATADGKPKVSENRSLELMLRDANGREISRQVVTTNAFGSASGEFVLPEGLLTGYFTIATQNGSVGFRVEEYKRPSFEITFDKIGGSYSFGDEITLTGRAENFSGVKLQHLPVNYRITRRHHMWWWRGGTAEHFTEGISKTDENGRFTIAFTPQKADEAASMRAIYTFDIEAVITDANGETVVGNHVVTVGDISMILTVEMPEKLEKSSAGKIIISARNLDGEDMKATGSYQLFSLLENDSIQRQLLQGSFETGEQEELRRRVRRLPSGKYRISLLSKDDRGNEITASQDFILFSYADKRPPVKSNDWFIVKDEQFAPGRNAEIILGATGKLNVLYELWQNGKLLERKWVVVNNENRLFSIPYKASYGEGVELMLTYVKEEQFYNHSARLLPVDEKKGLEVKLDVFRDKIRPGGVEEWRLTVRNAEGGAADAEVLASLYDFSLDRIAPSPRWILNLSRLHTARAAIPLQRDRSFDLRGIQGYALLPFRDVDPLAFDRLNWFDFSLGSSGRMMVRGMSKMGNVQMEAYGVVVAESDVSGEDGAGEAPAPVQIRRNFNETAFFFPQLRTNERGETQLSFTVPESNTRWRFRVLAHDRKLNSGEVEAVVVSQKELMVTPNMPRFLRHGDVVTIPAKISNLSDTTISGTARIILFDPLTDEPLPSGASQQQPFSVAPDASVDASWTFEVPDRIDLVGVRIIAQSESFSDGEQNLLAVLPNRMLVTESMPMDVNGNQSAIFTMEKMVNRSSPTVEDYRLMLEFASNPAWYAVQALPVLGTPDSDNAVSWFAACYANLLGQHISKTYPKVSAMIDAWKKGGGDTGTLLSNLEKNPELKGMLLEETPWVVEAKSESEQRQRLALLFDINRSHNLTRQAVEKLGELQTSSGGWSWFKGFNPSRSITQYILFGFSRLDALNVEGQDDDLRMMQAKAIAYIDGEALRMFEQLKRGNSDWRKIRTIPVADLEYLYVRSAYGEYPLDPATREMVDFYMSVIEKNWTLAGLYERSLIVPLMDNVGRDDIVADILKSYREHATISGESGMFWANNRAHLFMSQSAVSVHTFIMDAFRIGGSTQHEMESMKRWLLKQKQTQLWESTHATMDAVYALLSTGSDWFSGENRTTVTVGGNVLKPSRQEEGTGYFKEMWHNPEITPQMGSVKVENWGNAPAWGALYWQYYEDLDKITKTGGPLNVEKMLFVEETDATGRKLLPVGPSRQLKVGDKVVVRLTVRTDRDMEFVHLKDLYSAAFEPQEQLSGMRWNGGIACYQAPKDASVNLYFDLLPRGTYLFEYALFVTRSGDYSNGITTLQCIYAPEFRSHTAATRVTVR